MTETKKHLKDRKTIKSGFISRVFSVCKKVTAVFCVAGLVIITNTPLVFAYEAHTVNVTARIVNDMPCIDPPGGEFCNDGRLEIELWVNLAGADIYYTINGVNPICGENSENFKYNDEPFALPNGIITVKAVACHEETRNGGSVILQSAIMTEEFDASVPNVTVTKPVNGAIWYCNPSNPNIYPIEWIIENYRNANELSIDIVYIIDNGDVNREIDEQDERFLIAENLIGATGSYPFALIEEYCYYGYGWAEVTVTEASTDPNTDNCKNFGISGRIFDPMSCDSCGVSAPAGAPAISSNPTDADVESESTVNEENSEEESIDNNGADDEDAESEDSDNNINENINDVDMNNNNDSDEIDEDIKDEDADNPNDEKESVDNDENSVPEDEGIIADREEDFGEEEENNNDSNEDEDSEEKNDDEESDDEDEIVENSDVDSDDIDGESTNDDDDSPNDAPIEEDDDDSTEIEFSL